MKKLIILFSISINSYAGQIVPISLDNILNISYNYVFNNIHGFTLYSKNIITNRNYYDLKEVYQEENNNNIYNQFSFSFVWDFYDVYTYDPFILNNKVNFQKRNGNIDYSIGLSIESYISQIQMRNILEISTGFSAEIPLLIEWLILSGGIKIHLPFFVFEWANYNFRYALGLALKESHYIGINIIPFSNYKNIEIYMQYNSLSYLRVTAGGGGIMSWPSAEFIEEYKTINIGFVYRWSKYYENANK